MSEKDVVLAEELTKRDFAMAWYGFCLNKGDDGERLRTEAATHYLI